MRGVGKSRWARAALPDSAYPDLLDERLHLDLPADPGLFYQSVAGHLAPSRRDFTQRMARSVRAPRGLMRILRSTHGDAVGFQHSLRGPSNSDATTSAWCRLRTDQDVR